MMGFPDNVQRDFRNLRWDFGVLVTMREMMLTALMGFG